MVHAGLISISVNRQLVQRMAGFYFVELRLRDDESGLIAPHNSVCGTSTLTAWHKMAGQRGPTLRLIPLSDFLNTGTPSWSRFFLIKKTEND